MYLPMTWRHDLVFLAWLMLPESSQSIVDHYESVLHFFFSSSQIFDRFSLSGCLLWELVRPVLVQASVWTKHWLHAHSWSREEAYVWTELFLNSITFAGFIYYVFAVVVIFSSVYVSLLSSISSSHREDFNARDRYNARDNVSGVGGAGLFSDGKFSLFPAAERLWTLPDRARVLRAYAWILRELGVEVWRFILFIFLLFDYLLF
jgi:hypothetical protein